jgi:hypothetical protein
MIPLDRAQQWLNFKLLLWKDKEAQFLSIAPYPHM